MLIKRIFPYLILAAGLVAGIGCGDNRDVDNIDDDAVTIDSDKNAEYSAIAVLQPTEGNDGVKGTVTFIKTDEGVKIVADIKGLTPGDHGFHVHENGDCSAPDASSAGGHYNPTSHPHAAPDDSARHVGDMGNLTAGEDGRAQKEWVDNVMTLEGPYSVVGKAVIVHGGKDDLKSQPTGDAGNRLACGVIQRNE